MYQLSSRDVSMESCLTVQAQNFQAYMDVSKNRGTPKWMVYHGKPY